MRRINNAQSCHYFGMLYVRSGALPPFEGSLRRSRLNACTIVSHLQLHASRFSFTGQRCPHWSIPIFCRIAARFFGVYAVAGTPESKAVSCQQYFWISLQKLFVVGTLIICRYSGEIDCQEKERHVDVCLPTYKLLLKRVSICGSIANGS